MATVQYSRVVQSSAEYGSTKYGQKLSTVQSMAEYNSNKNK